MTTELYNLFLRSNGVCIDTREDLTNKIFFALPGKNVDSNTFCKSALEKGAIACVVFDPQLQEEEKCFYYKDTLKVLQDLAIRYRQEFQIPVLAITGSNGKTTTKELVYSILNRGFKTHATSGNYNNHIGLPLTILSAPRDTEILILEMGANAPGDIKQLCEIGAPTHGLITSIGRAHLEGFGDLNGVIKTKFELFDYLDKHSGICFINLMDENIRLNRQRMDTDINISDKGLSEGEAELKLIKTNPYVEFEIESEPTFVSIKSNLTGMHNWYNIINAISVSLILGVETNLIKEGIESYLPQNSRSQWVKYFDSLLLLDAYNANPSSVTAMFEDFDKIATSRQKYVILGEMAELGREKIAAHQEAVEMLKKSVSLSGYFLVGKIFKENEILFGTPTFENVAILKEYLDADFYKKNVMIMVKGSRSVKLEELFDSGNFVSFDSFD